MAGFVSNLKCPELPGFFIYHGKLQPVCYAPRYVNFKLHSKKILPQVAGNLYQSGNFPVSPDNT